MHLTINKPTSRPTQSLDCGIFHHQKSIHVCSTYPGQRGLALISITRLSFGRIQWHEAIRPGPKLPPLLYQSIVLIYLNRCGTMFNKLQEKLPEVLFSTDIVSNSIHVPYHHNCLIFILAEIHMAHFQQYLGNGNH